jgi:hypothetical protein
LRGRQVHQDTWRRSGQLEAHCLPWFMHMLVQRRLRASEVSRVV